MRVIYHPEAEAELIEAAQFYQRRVPGLGQRFLQAFDAAIEKIQQTPDQWQIIEGNLRRYLMPRFPYGIYFRVADEELRILVVKHHSRHPDYWKHRLDD